ncbi:MAG TPA: PAS domain S-box protein [Pyrinomonadaceae bacterium]|jgi:PAS domain S-box-containing protein
MKAAPTHPIVLTVNDDQRVLELLNVLLEHEGYRIISAASAARALEMVETIEPDIVISDVVMPEMDGLEFCRRLKQNPRTAYLPVMLVSALRKTEGDSLHGLVAGADDYLEIPFRRQELLVKVARLTERHRVERHYREIVEQAADIIYTRDMEGRLTSINEAGARFFGRPVSELVGSSLSVLLGEETAAADIAEMQHQPEADEPLRTVHPVHDAQGELHHLEAMTTLVRDAEGRPTGVRGVVRDITELKLAEEALREGQRVLSTLMSNLPGMAYRCHNDQDRTMEFVSEGCFELTGYSPADLVGNDKLSYAELIHPDDQQMVWEAVQSALSEQKPFQLNYRIKTANVEERWVWEQGRGVFNSTNQLLFIEGFIADITERKRADEALRESERRHRQMFEQNQAIKLLIDPETGDIIDANQAACEFYGYSLDELKAKKIGEINTLPPGQIKSTLTEALTKRNEHFHFQHRLASGEIRDVEVYTGPIDYQGRRILFSIILDVTERRRAEEKLRASEEKYRTIFNNATMGIYQSLPDGRLLAVNSTLVRLLGYDSVEELLERNVARDIYFHEEDRQKLIAAHEDSGVASDVEVLWKKKDNSPIWIHLNAHAVKDEQGRTLYFDGFVQDVTSRKQAEAARRESEERYRELFENANDIIYMHDLQGNFTSLNKTGERITGYSREEAVRMNIADILAPEQLEIARQMIDRKRSEKVSTVYELEIISKEGSRVALEVSTRLIHSDGVPIGVQGIARDVTERKRVKAELQASEAELRALFAAMPDVIMVLDAGGRYLKIAPTNPKLLYKPSADLLNKRLHDVMPAAQADAFLSQIRRALETRQPIRVEYSLQIEETEVWFEGTVSPMLEDSVVWVARDINERKHAAEALAEQAEREALINRISSSVRSSLDVSEVFSTAVRELGLHLGVDRCSVYMKHEEVGLVRNMAEFHAPGVLPAPRDFSISQAQDLIAGIQQNGVLAFDDAAHDERISQLYHRSLRMAGVRSIMYVAIKVGEETPAAFAISTTRSIRHWSETDIALAKAVAIQTGIAIRQAELYRKAEATSAREALINRLSLAIRASLSLPEVLRTATRELGRALNASHVHLRLYDPADPRSTAEHEYVAPGVASTKHVELSFEGPIGRYLLHAAQPIIVDDVLNYKGSSPDINEHIRAHAVKIGVRAQIDWPLSVNGNFRGVLCIHQMDRVRHWTEDELALVEAVASQLATGIAQAELFEMTKRAKKEWETTFNAMSDGIFIFDRAGQLIRVNRAGAAMEDTWPHLLLGRHCCDILRTSSDERVCVVENTLAEGRSLTLEVTPERFNRPLLVTAEPVIESGSRTVGVVCTARDLSELRKVEARAREHQSLLMNILESAREAIYAVDTEGYFQWCNSATVAAMGGRVEDLIGHHFLEVTFEADRALAAESFEKAVKGEPRSYEARFSGKDGQLRYALIDNAPIVVDGQTTAVLGIARDVTEQKQERERAAQADKLRALGQLASGVAHDFNNALAAILGRAQLMRRDLRDKRLTHNLDIIQTAAEDAAATVRRIQTFARQSEAKEFDLLDVSSLLRDAVEITRTRWQNEASMRGLFYAVDIDTEEQLYVAGNASELREVFVNLIVNAVDAMPLGGQLLISSRKHNERVRLCFTDSGTGMTEEVRKRIFEPFYTTKGAQGTGLGLAVSYGIVERHEGHINVESKLGEGTTFEIDLPAATYVPAQTSEPFIRHETPSLKVLVIDDEDFVRETLADMLTALAHEVVLADGGHEALAKLDSDHFDLVFTDLSMPGMDGWEVAREIRRRTGTEIGIVLVTGYGKATALPPGEQDLVNGVIGKPFDFDQVAETIAKVSAETRRHGDAVTRG